MYNHLAQWNMNYTWYKNLSYALMGNNNIIKIMVIKYKVS